MITRPLTRPLVGALSRGLTQAGAGGGFDPASLFGVSDVGCAFDFTDPTKLFQLSGGTGAVTTVGDPIGYAVDISGKGKQAIQATSGSRPTYNGYATFDGTDDSLATAAIDMTGTDKLTLIVSVKNGTNGGVGMMVEFSVDSTIPGTFLLYHTGSQIVGRITGSTSAILTTAVSTAPAGAKRLETMLGDIAQAAVGDEIKIRIDGAQVGTAPTGGAGAGNLSNNVLYLGRRAGASLPWSGDLYRLILIGRTLTAAELLAAEAWCNDPLV